MLHKLQENYSEILIKVENIVANLCTVKEILNRRLI
jgi:hypothetical protein